MRIDKLLNINGPVFSFEFFPPKTAAGEQTLYQTIERLRPLRPTFVSVTYGAGGGTRDKTLDLVRRIKHEIGIEAMAHLTCVGADQDEILGVLQRLVAAGIENVLALRGDPPRDQAGFVRPANGFGYAVELVRFIRQQGFGFCLGGACYPEGHVECRDREQDLLYLKRKVDSGLQFVITQLFFDNTDYFAFVERARACGVRVPIIPGIMPITNLSQIERFTALCGARIPKALRSRLEQVRSDDAAVRAVGIEHATLQCRDLLERGAPGIHFYTLNQSTATRAIFERLRG
ncbi:MAG TPA: methylenetetrahydrofolate reductase [NAD(P)H] [Candidatus Margulisiibacteriota bacterium]|nr:methylenetetrahydrofolate reductase [NAD(P)H] [Candidatus Margulisiibacteriota bacterium]